MANFDNSINWESIIQKCKGLICQSRDDKSFYIKSKEDVYYLCKIHWYWSVRPYNSVVAFSDTHCTLGNQSTVHCTLYTVQCTVGNQSYVAWITSTGDLKMSHLTLSPMGGF